MTDATELTCELHCDEVYELICFIGWFKGVCGYDDVKPVYDKLKEWFNLNVRGDNT